MLLLVAMAFAAEPECEACCRRAGITECEVTLRVVGEESRTHRDRGGTRVEGLYVVGCDGRAFFDDDRLAYFMNAPTAGELAMPESDPQAIACFLSACELPRDACVTEPDGQGRRHLQHCATATALDAYAIRRAPTGERPRSVPALAAAPEPAPPPGVPPSVVLVEGIRVDVRTAPVVMQPVAAVDPFTGTLPADPPAECYPPAAALYQAARAQVMLGDDKRILGDHGGAVSGYRAALTMDACSAYGWLGLGQSALALDRPDIAVRALKNATRLMATHYGAWLDLGRAYEAIAQSRLAHSAYERALELNGDLAEANAGWRRTLVK